jgi:CBS domain containing-hemolysin-like protein
VATDSYIVSGKVEIDHINEKYNLNIEEGDYETLAGFVTSGIGRIPAQGETVTVGNFKIQVIRANAQKVELVKLTVLHPTH